jgi:ABC-type uncharacterized transport system substrate-binding protein
MSAFGGKALECREGGMSAMGQKQTWRQAQTMSEAVAMKRRAFIGLLGGAVVAFPLSVFAQQRDHLRRIGVLMGFAETDEVWQTYLRVFRERLRDFGWTDGQNVTFDYRFAGESAECTRLAASELVSSKPDVLFVSTNPAVSALLRETHTIPIVFTWVSDSVGSGYVSSLAHPGAM